MKGLIRYIITRIALTIPMVFILLTIVFVVLRVMPGDPVSALLGAHAPQRVIDQKKEELGLNKPLYVQYANYIGQIARFDLGNSMVLKQTVWSTIRDKLPATIELTLFGMFFTLLIGVPLGAFAARNRRSPADFGIRIFGNVAYCIPVYWMGLMLQLFFAVWLHWFPVAGRTGARIVISSFSTTGFYVLDAIIAGNIPVLLDVLDHLFLPAITLGIVLSGVFIRLTRANMLDTLKADFILAAHARGVPDRSVTYRHGLKNAFVPILTMLGLQFAILLSGAILTETTFSWPGMGRLLVERIYLRDYPVVQGVIVIFAVMVSVISLIVDLFYALIDPRVKY